MVEKRWEAKRRLPPDWAACLIDFSTKPSFCPSLKEEMVGIVQTLIVTTFHSNHIDCLSSVQTQFLWQAKYKIDSPVGLFVNSQIVLRIQLAGKVTFRLVRPPFFI